MKQETIEGAAIAYSEYRFITPDCISERAEERCLACKEGFITGVSWYKSRVWHQVSLLPEEDKIAAILTNCKHLIIIEVNKDWENLIKSFRGQAWAYYENLLPTSIDCIIEEDKALLLKQFNERKERKERHERWKED